MVSIAVVAFMVISLVVVVLEVITIAEAIRTIYNEKSRYHL